MKKILLITVISLTMAQNPSNEKLKLELNNAIENINSNNKTNNHDNATTN